LVVTVSGVGQALAIDALSFVFAAAALRAGLPDVAAEHTGFRARARAGIDHVRRAPLLRRLFTLDLALAIVFALILPIEVVYVTGTLGASVGAYGVVLAAWGAGAVVGSIALTRLAELPRMPVLLVSLSMLAASYIAMGSADSVPLVALFSLVGGSGNGMEGTVLLTMVQETTAERFQAPVNGLLESMHAGAPGVGFVLGGLLTAALSARATYLIAGSAALVVIAVAAVGLDAGVRPARLFHRSSSAIAPS
jgi:hypothetical protein